MEKTVIKAILNVDVFFLDLQQFPENNRVRKCWPERERIEPLFVIICSQTNLLLHDRGDESMTDMKDHFCFQSFFLSMNVSQIVNCVLKNLKNSQSRTALIWFDKFRFFAREDQK